MLKPSPNVRSSYYRAVQRRLHWIVALMLLLQFALQGPMRRAMDLLEQDLSLSAMGFLVTTIHTLNGAAMGLLVLWRLRLRWERPVVVAKMALWVHRLMYALLLVMVITGTLNYYFGLSFAARWHELGKWLILGLVLLHICAALWHHFVVKDSVLRQMLGIASHTDTMAD